MHALLQSPERRLKEKSLETGHRQAALSSGDHDVALPPILILFFFESAR
jgi:hypothetical protein